MSLLNVYLFLITGAVCELCILYIVENQRWSLIPRAAYGYKISAALLNDASEDICVFIVYNLVVVFVFIKYFCSGVKRYVLPTHYACFNHFGH